MERRQNPKSLKVKFEIDSKLQILKKNIFLTDTPFSQQQLPAWQPILTPGTVLPTFFVIGIAFVAIGIGLLYFSNDVKETVIEYTDCKNDLGEMCHDVINRTDASASAQPCKCDVTFELKEDWPKDVYMYYALTNFYQNHRRYVKSRDEKQLLGDINKVPDDNCAPYNKIEGSELPVVPCGAIANSLFNGKLQHTVRNLHFLSKNSTLISRENCRFFAVKNS